MLMPEEEIKAPDLLGNVSSRVPRDHMDGFVEKLVEDVNLGFPIFSVSDCNSFHTSGYLWGLYAALKLKKEGLPLKPIAVINFDFHQDFGSFNMPHTGSDRWGRVLLDTIASLGFPACYLSIFNDPGTDSAFACRTPSAYKKYKRKAEEKKAAKAKRPIHDALEFLSRVKESRFGGEPIGYVFVTIDRDVLQNSYTQWGDGAIQNIGKLSEELLSLLKGLGVCQEKAKPGQAELIGFDVTGLPEHLYMIPGAKKEKVKGVYKRVAEELNILQSIASTELKLPPGSEGLSSALLFSGSTSYTGPPEEKTHTHEQMAEEMTKWNYMDFLLNTRDYLQPWLQKAKPISYILNTRKPPIYAHGIKSFSVHPNKPALQRDRNPADIIGKGTDVGGFPSTASISDISKLGEYYHKVTAYKTSNVQDAIRKYSDVKWSEEDQIFVPNPKVRKFKVEAFDRD